MNTKEVFEVFGIMLLALVLAVTFLTMTRTCETLDHNGNVVSMNCMEISSFEK